MSFVEEKNGKDFYCFLYYSLWWLSFSPPPFRSPPPPLSHPGLSHHYHHLPVNVHPPHPLCNTTLHQHHNCRGLHRSHHPELFPFTALKSHHHHHHYVRSSHYHHSCRRSHHTPSTSSSSSLSSRSTTLQPRRRRCRYIERKLRRGRREKDR